MSAEKLAENPEQAARAYVFIATIQGDLGNQAAAADAFAEVLKREPAAENLQVSPSDFFLQYGKTFLRLGKPTECEGGGIPSAECDVPRRSLHKPIRLFGSDSAHRYRR